jgi:assimilatory nitrate reductase catalytic subunit
VSVNKDTFQRREPTYDFQSAGEPPVSWAEAGRLPDTLVPTHCCFCGVQCGMYLRVARGQVTGVEPRDFPHNQGKLCPKGIVAYQQVGHPERLRHPLMRRGGKASPLERCTWDEALDYVVRRWQAIQVEHGKDAVAVYSGSSMTNEKCYLVGKFARVGLGTRHIDYNGRLCMSSAAVAYARAFGLDRAPLPLPDIALSDCLFIAGSNVAECFPIAMNWLWQARDRGARLIVMDPRETATARTADLWLPVRPGTDIAVLNCILRQLIHDGAVDERYLQDRTHGWEQVREAVEPYTPDVAERIAGVRAERVLAAARLFGRAERPLIMHARGIEHSSHGVDNVLACINLALARGMVGQPGAGTMMITGQGNGQGGREHGQKANQLPGYRHIDVLEERQYIADVWGIPEPEIPAEGAAATEMPRLMLHGDIKSCLVICSNLMVSLPDVNLVRRALDSLDPLVVIDFFLSETAALADVVLPGSVWCEDEGTTTNLEGRVIKINWAADPPGEAKRDVWIIQELARRLGRGKFFPYTSSRQIWDELRLASKGGVADYYGITWEKIDAQGGVFWPCPDLAHPGTPRLFAERFAHADGKANMFPIVYTPPAEEPGGDYPFRLTTGRVVYHYLSGTQTRRLGFLNSQAPEPWVEVHPVAAEKLGIRTDDLVRVRTPRDAIELKALVVPTIRPDTLFIPFHYGGRHAVNLLTNPAVDPTVKIPEYKISAAALERLDQPERAYADGPTINFTPDTAPRMFPYAMGEDRSAAVIEAKRF